MANPQLEDGHTKIANELVEALSRTNLSPYESRVLWFIIRKTYGWGKKRDKIPLSQIVGGTGITKQHVLRTLKSLVSRSIVARTGDKQTYINKDYEQWVPKQATQGSNLNRLPKYPLQATKVASTGDKKYPVQGPSKAKSINKSINKSNSNFPEWLDIKAWDAFVEMRKKIKKPLTDYATQLTIIKLSRLRDEGHDPTKVLEQSIVGSWQGLYELKEAPHGERVSRDSRPGKSRVRPGHPDYGK